MTFKQVIPRINRQTAARYWITFWENNISIQTSFPIHLGGSNKKEARHETFPFRLKKGEYNILILSLLFFSLSLFFATLAPLKCPDTRQSRFRFFKRFQTYFKKNLSISDILRYDIRIHISIYISLIFPSWGNLERKSRFCSTRIYFLLEKKKRENERASKGEKEGEGKIKEFQ